MMKRIYSAWMDMHELLSIRVQVAGGVGYMLNMNIEGGRLGAGWGWGCGVWDKFMRVSWVKSLAHT